MQRKGIKYMGIVESSTNSFTHLDLHVVKWEELPFYTLYFSSGKYFSTLIRKYAKDKGYILNEKGIYKNNRKISAKNEKDIFNILRIKWISPEERNNTITLKNI